MKYLIIPLVLLLVACSDHSDQITVNKNNVVCTPIKTERTNNRYGDVTDTTSKCVFLSTEREPTSVYEQRKKLEKNS